MQTVLSHKKKNNSSKLCLENVNNSDDGTWPKWHKNRTLQINLLGISLQSQTKYYLPTLKYNSATKQKQNVPQSNSKILFATRNILIEWSTL